MPAVEVEYAKPDKGTKRLALSMDGESVDDVRDAAFDAVPNRARVIRVRVTEDE